MSKLCFFGCQHRSTSSNVLFFVFSKLADAREHITDLTNANNLLGIDRRRLEGDLRGAQQELDKLVNAVKHAEEKARKAITDAGKVNVIGTSLM